MNIIKYLSWTIVVLCGLIPTALYILLATTTGSSWLIQKTLKYTEQDIVIQQVSGSLLNTLQLTQVTLNTPTSSVSVDQATLSWRPFDLFEQKVSVDSVTLEGVQVKLIETEKKTGAKVESQAWQLPTIVTPWPITIDQLKITEALINTTAQTITLTDIKTKVMLHGSTLSLSEFHIGHEQINADLMLQLDLDEQYPFELGFILSTADLEQLHVPAARISGSLKGDSQHLILNADLSLKDQPSAGAKITATANELQFQPSWEANVTIIDVPISLLNPWLPENENDWIGLLKAAAINASAQIDSERISITETIIGGIGKNGQGSITLAGDVSQYMSYSEQPEQVQFDITATARAISMPERRADMPDATLNSAEISVTGSPELYSLAVGTHWTLMDTDDVTFSLAGIGTMNSLALSEINVGHATFDAALTAQLGWLESPWAAVNITQFIGRLPLFEKTYELILTGGFGFINGAISANQVEASINGTQLTANGALSPDNALGVTLTIPNLEDWVASPYAQAKVELSAAISGDYLKQLDFSMDALQLTSEPFGRWQTKDSSQLKLSLGNFDINGTPLCLHEQRDRNPASVCVSAQLSQQDLLIDIDAKKLPLRLLNRFREADVAERIWGNVDTTAVIKIARTDGTIDSMSGMFRSENTSITSLDDNLTSRLREWELRWSGNLDSVSGTLQAYVADDMGQVIGDLTLTDILHQQSLDGSLDLAINDLTLLQWILPDLRYVGASAVANIAVSGSLAHPALTGAIELIADEIGFAQSGLLLTKVRLALEDKLDETGILRLVGQARSGNGWIGLDGEIDVPNRELSLDIDGDTFRAVELAMAQVDVSPDLNIKVANQRIDITGTVTVPYAKINEPDLSSSATVSNDIRLYNHGEPVIAEDESLYPIHANIRVILSDNVTIDAYGFKGKVSGSIRLIEEPERALRATGSIQVAEGNYEIYGQELEIQRGVLIYNGGTIDNPGLDLRVVRTAASMTAAASEQITVGARVGGTLLTPDFRLFSTPAMQDAEILSYLILGRPPGGGGSNNLQLQALLLIGSQGTDLIGKKLQDTFGLDEFGIDSTADPLDTSFYIGKYLSPKLYVKYGVGLFENTNTFYIRYLLTDKLIIESTTSTEAQGGDILYTIEK